MGVNELHQACGGHTSTVALAQPQLLREKDGSGRLPLNYAAMHGAPLRLVVALAEAYAEALAVESIGGYTPLAVAQHWSERQQPGVLNCLQHYVALRQAATCRDWDALAAFQRHDGGAPAAWVAALAQRHGAPASTVGKLSATFGLAELIAAGAWELQGAVSGQQVHTQFSPQLDLQGCL